MSNRDPPPLRSVEDGADSARAGSGSGSGSTASGSTTSGSGTTSGSVSTTASAVAASSAGSGSPASSPYAVSGAGSASVAGSVNPAAGTLTIRLDPLPTARESAAVAELCAHLTATATTYPGTDLTLRYEIKKRP